MSCVSNTFKIHMMQPKVERNLGIKVGDPPPPPLSSYLHQVWRAGRHTLIAPEVQPEEETSDSLCPAGSVDASRPAASLQRDHRPAIRQQLTRRRRTSTPPPPPPPAPHSRPTHKISNFLKYDQVYERCFEGGNPPPSSTTADSAPCAVSERRTRPSRAHRAKRESEERRGPGDGTSVSHTSRRDPRRPLEWHQTEHITEEHCCLASGHHVRPRCAPQGPKAAPGTGKQGRNGKGLEMSKHFPLVHVRIKRKGFSSRKPQQPMWDDSILVIGSL